MKKSKPNLSLLVKAYEHIETSYLLVEKGNYRDFCSRFYYAYITLLRSIYKCRGNWHDKNTYRGIPKHLNSYRDKLRVWRIMADYTTTEQEKWCEKEEEFLEFLYTDFLDILNTIVDELESVENYNKCKHIAYLIIKKVKEMHKWLKLLKLTSES